MCWNFDETQRDLVIYFTTPKIVTESQVNEIALGFQVICKRAASAHKNLVIDFRGLGFMSSLLMGKIVLLNKEALTNNVKIGFRNVGPNVLEVFRICRLDKVFLLHGGDGGQEPTGTMVPRPRRPSSDSGHADPPSNI
jgi:anti-anti-sigma factor